MAATLAASTAPAAQLEWIGGTDDSWHTPANWAPIEVPGQEPIQRVPQDGDNVMILDGTHGANVRLDADSAVLESLLVGNAFELNTGGHVLNIAGPTTLAGNGTMLTAHPRSWESNHLPAFETRLLHIGDGASVQLVDAVLQVKEQARIETGGELGGYGEFIFGEESTPAGTVALVNDGTLGTVRTDRPFRFGWASIIARGGAVLDFDGETEQGTIDLDRTERVSFTAGVPLADPYNGPLSIRAGDSFYSYGEGGPFAFEDTTISIDGGPQAAEIFGDILVDGDSTLIIEPGVADFDGSFRMLGGTFRSFGTVGMQTSDGASFEGLDEKEFGPNSRFFLEDGSSLHLPNFDYAASLNVESKEIDLDGDTGDVEITVGLWSSLHLEASTIDNDPLSPGFDGTLTLGGDLTMNVGDGWELDGRLELDSILGAAQLYGTPITVDGGEPGDGIFVAGTDSDALDDYTIHTDVVFTENGWLGIVEDIGYLRITGSMEANGTLQYFKHYEDYDPPVGTVYRLLDAEGGITGRFARLEFFPLPADRGWYVQYGATRIEAHVVEPLPGDYNANGLVEQADLDLVLGNWGHSAEELPAGWVNDLPSGIIDQAELDRVLAGWGSRVQLPTEGGVGAVPEPVSWKIVLLMSAIIWPAGLAQRTSIAISSP